MRDVTCLHGQKHFGAYACNVQIQIRKTSELNVINKKNYYTAQGSGDSSVIKFIYNLDIR